jgi:hypothetical protein
MWPLPTPLGPTCSASSRSTRRTIPALWYLSRWLRWTNPLMETYVQVGYQLPLSPQFALATNLFAPAANLMNPLICPPCWVPVDVPVASGCVGCQWMCWVPVNVLVRTSTFFGGGSPIVLARLELASSCLKPPCAARGPDRLVRKSMATQASAVAPKAYTRHLSADVGTSYTAAHLTPSESRVAATPSPVQKRSSTG